MIFVYEDVRPTLIPNTIIQKRLRDGVDYQYWIEAVDGYVLHDKRIDEPVYDDFGNETEEIMPWFKIGVTTVAANYDFDNITNGTYTYVDENNMTVTIDVLKVGMNEFYAIPNSIVPNCQICNNEII